MEKKNKRKIGGGKYKSLGTGLFYDSKLNTNQRVKEQQNKKESCLLFHFKLFKDPLQ